ncbi:hypothetical protein [Chitinilyticum aquatile]|uniref:hypothetical protein n=1 Tax=Chitinilyticum aquatile TaxID=362520 RepID=UPI00048FF64B|nr:hypothetical protein [Chitinilyticum aquatile]
MSAWWFVITVDSVPPDWGTEQSPLLLASWEEPVTGLHWISKLVAAGEAEQLPSQRSHLCEEYRSKASFVLPILLSLQSGTARSSAVKQLNMPLIHQCTAEQPLLISVWDLG